MRKIIILCASMMFALTNINSKEQLELKSITRGDFYGERLAAVKPAADGETYMQISKDKRKILKFSFKTGKQVATVFDLDNVRGPKIRIDAIDGYIVSPDGRNILIQTDTQPIYRRSFTAYYYIFDVRNNKMVALSNDGPQQTPIFSPDGTQIAFVRENNIFLVKLLYDNAESQITKDGKFNEIINGVPDWVYEEEFTTNSSMVFTADSRQICWIKYDESHVKQYSMQLFRGSHPDKDEYATYPGLYTYKYPKAGEDNSKVSVWSFDIKSRQTRQLNVPVEAEGYIPRIAATADPEKVAVFTLNRHQDQMCIYMVNPLSTVAKLVIQDNVDKYIKEAAAQDVRFVGNMILVPSERDGFNHLYLYNINGQLKRKVTTGNYEVLDIYGMNEATGDVFYAANPDGATEKQVYVSHANGKTEKLTPKAGYNSAIFSSNFKYFINVWNDINNPTTYTLNTVGGKQSVTLIDNKDLKDKWAQYDVATPELFSFTTSEGTKLNGWMIKPTGFNASKRYPVIMFQYGGPGSQQVLNSWNIGCNGQGAVMEQYMAQQGYLVVCVDNRGTGGRGAAFEKCTYLRLGEKEAFDQVETALWLGKQSFVDKDRIGIWGWSYGGWNTLMSMSEGRPVFRAGVAVAPPTCWRYYDTVYTERFMRTPKENKSGYDEVNPIARASKLHGALLICHGLADDNVHYQNSAEYVEALVQADKDFKQLVYTNRNHGISGGNTRNHLFRQIINWFNNELKK